MKTPATDEWSSVSMFRLVGYSLLLLAIIDSVSTVLSVAATTSGWQLQVIGPLIERIPLPLIGLILVFSGEGNVRQKWEKVFLKGLSWVALVAGILFLLIIPVLLTATIQANIQNDAQVSIQAEQQSTQLQKLGQQVNQASPQDLEGFLNRLNQEANAVPTIRDPQSLKSQLLKEVDQAQKALKSQAESTRNGQRAALLTNAGKWSLGALVAGLTLVRLWHMSGWARRKNRTNFNAASI